MSDTADFDPKDFERPYSDGGTHAKFYTKAVPDAAASAEAGSPKFTDKVYVEIMTPGNSTNIIDRPIRDTDKRRFPQQYAAFVAGDSEQITGTPLTEVTWVPRSIIEELTYAKVRTVEQLAEINDNVCTRTPGMFDMKRKAIAWLENAKQAAPFTKIFKENEDLQARLAAMEEQLAALSKPKVDKKSAAA
jgi:hypothetical protein